MQTRRKTFRQVQSISKGRKGTVHMADTLNSKKAAWLLHKIGEEHGINTAGKKHQD